MKKPKTKPKVPPPKTIKRSVRTPKGVKTGIDKATDGIYEIDKANKAIKKELPHNESHENPENYAADNISEVGEYTTRKTAQKTVNAANKIGRHGYEKIRQNSHNKKQDKFEQRIDKDVKKAKTKAQAQYQAKRTSEKTAQTTKFSQIRHGSDKKTAKNAIHAGMKNKRNIKSATKEVKKTKKTIKATKKGLKTTTRSSKSVVQATKRAAAAAKKTAIATAKAVKVSVKALIAAIKVAITAIKGLISAIIAGGWVVVVVIIIIAVIIAVVSSPIAIFTNESNGTTPTISEVVQDINGEYSNTINNIITNSGEIDEIIIEGETATNEFSVNNWVDVIGIFSVKSTVTSSEEEYISIVYMENRQINDLKSIFWDMNNITYEIIEEIIEPDPTPIPTQSPTPNPYATPSPEPTPEPTPEIYRTLIISIESKSFEDGITMYNLSDKQIEALYELMSSEYMPLFMEICNMDSYIGLTPEQMNNLINDLPEGELGSVIVEYAVSRLGHPYSQPLRGQGNYVDCSYFARWCYQQAGISQFTAGTAAEQARYCVNNGLCIAYSDLQPGDLIFWSFNVNGRFMNIGHVGVYAGNGYVIDASSSRGMVVYRPIFGQSSIVACARPHVLN